MAGSSGAPQRVGGFSYRTVISERTKSVKSAPAGYGPTWKEHVEEIVAADRKDADFSRLMRGEALRSKRGFDYEGSACKSFDTCQAAGSLDIREELLSASPDLVSVRISIGFYEAGMAHPDSAGVRSYVWSRRLHRLLRESDVFAVRPDRALRRLAQSNFDNRDAMTNPDATDGIPLEWRRATIGPDGITWFFDSYELGGYPSAGTATIKWSALKPYLRRNLPFAIDAIRSAPGQFDR
jgi:hypothetical protein